MQIRFTSCSSICAHYGRGGGCRIVSVNDGLWCSDHLLICLCGCLCLFVTGGGSCRRFGKSEKGSLTWCPSEGLSLGEGNGRDRVASFTVSLECFFPLLSYGLLSVPCRYAGTYYNLRPYFEVCAFMVKHEASSTRDVQSSPQRTQQDQEMLCCSRPAAEPSLGQSLAEGHLQGQDMSYKA